MFIVTVTKERFGYTVPGYISPRAGRWPSRTFETNDQAIDYAKLIYGTNGLIEIYCD